MAWVIEHADGSRRMLGQEGWTAIAARALTFGSRPEAAAWLEAAKRETPKLIGGGTHAIREAQVVEPEYVAGRGATSDYDPFREG